jgi:hypothetical protein
MKENELKIQLLFFIIFMSPFTWGSSSFQGTFDDDGKVKHLLEMFQNNTLELLGTVKNSDEIPIESTIEIKFGKFAIKNSIKITPSGNESGQEKQVSSQTTSEPTGISHENKIQTPHQSKASVCEETIIPFRNENGQKKQVSFQTTSEPVGISHKNKVQTHQQLGTSDDPFVIDYPKSPSKPSNNQFLSQPNNGQFLLEIKNPSGGLSQPANKKGTVQ